MFCLVPKGMCCIVLLRYGGISGVGRTILSIYIYVRRTFRVYLTYGFALFINTISTRAFQILRILKISDAFKIFNF